MSYFSSARRPTPPPANNPLLGSPPTSSASSSTLHGYRPPEVRSARGSEDSLREYRKSEDDDLTSLESDDDFDRTRVVDDLDYQNGIELGELGGGAARERGQWKGRWGTLRRRVDRWTKQWSLSRPRWLPALPKIRFPSIPESWKGHGAVFGRFIGLLVLIASGYALFALAIFPAAQNELASMFDPEGVRQFAQSAADSDRIRGFLQHITSYDHMAGTRGSFYLGEWIQDVFLKAGLEGVHLEGYEAYLNFPRADGRRVAIIDPVEQGWQAKLEEELAYPTGTVGKANTPVFHGHSRSGNATGPLIYFNYGSRADYKHVCSDLKINCIGSIALVKSYGTQSSPALKIKAAEEWGIKGVLIYSDPADDGSPNGSPWPAGRWRPADSVRRDGVALSPWVMGDPLTPGWASKSGAKRLALENNPGLVNIPSLPLSARDAQKLLQALKGHGQKVDKEWQGGVPDVEWWTGDDKSPVVLLENSLDDVVEQKVFNVMAKIEGLESKGRSVIVGNHRDSWCFGAADPGSGTAVMLEVASILGKLRAQGWQPLRDIVFASFDAGAYNMIGSTEFVEDHLDDLREGAIAYINVDSGVSGGKFKASGSPLFRRPLTRVLDRVADPIRNKTIKDIWAEDGFRMDEFAYDSDYAAFQSLAGTTSVDIGFEGDKYPQHSCYETMEWVEKYGDPELKYHKALAQIWVLLILELSQNRLLSLGAVDYATALSSHTQTLSDEVARAASKLDRARRPDLGPLQAATRAFAAAARLADDWEAWWVGQVHGAGGAVETNALARARRGHNARLADVDVNLLDVERKGDAGVHGLVGRGQFRHVVIGPGQWGGGTWFPLVRDAVERGDWEGVDEALKRTAEIVRLAAEKLGREVG